MDKKENKYLVVLFLLVIVIGLLSYPLGRDRDFSENENRYLAKRPKLNMERVLSGQYSKDTEKYIDDQFFLRDEFIGLKTDLLQFLGRQDINGVYIARDNYLIEKILENEIDKDQLVKNISSINDFEESLDIPVTTMVVPTSGLILKDKLPKYAEVFDQDKYINEIKKSFKGKFVDTRRILTNKNHEYIYYKTDHHWTSLGAYYGYMQYVDDMKLKSSISHENFAKVSDSFKGSLYSKVLIRNQESDEIYIYSGFDNYKIDYSSNNYDNDEVYDYDKLKEKDQYQVFLGGNHSEINIEMDNSRTKKILVLKDSYGNAMIPFLMENYKNIDIIDLRYFKGDIKSYIEDKEIDEVLILYNIVNFSKEKSISKLKG